MVIDKKTSKIWNFFVLHVYFFPLKFVEFYFVVSITSSHLITESSIIFAKYLPFSQRHVVRFQIQTFSHR